jgi:hypothetical protein
MLYISVQRTIFGSLNRNCSCRKQIQISKAWCTKMQCKYTFQLVPAEREHDRYWIVSFYCISFFVFSILLTRSQYVAICPYPEPLQGEGELKHENLMTTDSSLYFHPPFIFLYCHLRILILPLLQDMYVHLLQFHVIFAFSLLTVTPSS